MKIWDWRTRAVEIRDLAEPSTVVVLLVLFAPEILKRLAATVSAQSRPRCSLACEFGFIASSTDAEVAQTDLDRSARVLGRLSETSEELPESPAR